MVTFLLHRLVQATLLLVLVSMMGFGLLHLAPGGPLAQFAQASQMSGEDVERLTKQLGLDRPLPVQYADWVGRVVEGDWGKSYRDDNPVLDVIGSHLGATFELMFVSMVLAILVGCTVGIVGALRRHTLVDHVATMGSLVVLSIPTFWLGILIIYLFAVKLGWLPAGNRESIGDGSVLDRLHHLIAPVTVLALVEMAIWARYMRAAMIDVVGQDFIRTARAKGLREGQILTRHMIPSALLPMITLAGLQFPMLLGGALVTETVFTWPGMGRLFLDSIEYRDYPVVMGILMLSAVMVLLGSLLADVMHAVVDPRIRLG